MKRSVIAALAAMILCGSFSSCSKDDDEFSENEVESKKYEYYDYSEKGFWMDGEVKVRGYFDTDSVMEGYSVFLKCTADYRTVDGEDGVDQLGYRFSVVIRNLLSFYSTDVVYNNDSTAISSFGTVKMHYRDKQSYDAIVTAEIDSVGKPHLATCNALIDAKNVVFQFREK